MRILIAEDDFASRKFLTKFLSRYGECDATVNGVEALDAYMMALGEERPYDLICLDIMMPELDGISALKAIRDLETHGDDKPLRPAKIIMTTALNDADTVTGSFGIGCDAYAAKPIDIEKFVAVMRKLGLISHGDEC